MTEHRVLDAHILDRLREESGNNSADRTNRRPIDDQSTRHGDDEGDCFPHSRYRRTNHETWYRKEILRLSRALAEVQEENRTLRALKTTAHQKVAKRLAGVESKVKELLNANKNLEKKRILDAEGWRAELTLLRQRIDSVERRLRRLGIMVHLPDGDHRDVIIKRDSQWKDETEGSISQLCHEFASVQLTLDRLSERLPV